MKISISFFAFTISLLMLSAAISPALALSSQITEQTMSGASAHNKNYYSTNWSGYEVSGSSGTVTSVSGSWTVPIVTGSNGYSSFWVGIDGFSSSTVEQIGTASDISGGVASYYAWYEFYPNAPVDLSSTTYPVNFGDVMSATVNYLSSTTTGSKHHVTVNDVFSVTISDETADWTFSTQGTVANAAMSSAEWIAEAPSSITGVLPLANFGTVYFTSSSATINGQTGSINNWQYNSITMASGRGIHLTIKAQPSSLSIDGTSFSVEWLHS
jgi:hypothetical protein